MTDLLINLYVQPNAKKSEFVGMHNHLPKIKLAAPAVDGKANNELIAFIAKQFYVSKSMVKIVKGQTSRYKTLLISGYYVAPSWFTF